MKDNLSSYTSNDYDSRINSVLPYYAEFHNQILDLAECLGLSRINWLDTGCGTGNLAQKVLKKFDTVDLTLCDPSEAMLEKSKDKLKEYKNVKYVNLASQQLGFDNEFDIVTAVQAHHYLDRNQRANATKKCFDALKDGGVYITFENISLSCNECDELGMRRWKKYLLEHGKSEEEAESHIKRRGTEVFPVTIEEHISLLKKTGFKAVEILWMSYMQAGFWAIK
ncbi:class I SAM-dependent methyltransferase [Ruminococcus sp.]|uniref:class I SAM-dependent methyltransferase n=1 Tax=Ruminococcus sp. TaxID=41978 RepID=UPI003F042B5B